MDKISQTSAEWHVDCGDMVEIETRCRIPIWWTFGRIQWNIITKPPATLANQCHDPRATYHIAGCCHLLNSLSRLQGAVVWRNQCHDRATLQGVRIPSTILKIVFRHILYIFLFLGFDKRRLLYPLTSSIHLFDVTLKSMLGVT